MADPHIQSPDDQDKPSQRAADCFTPEPWVYRDGSVYAGDTLIALPAQLPGQAEACAEDWLRYSELSEIEGANARLIAAAPDLLAALRDITAGLNEAVDSRPLIRAQEVRAARAARAALAKATGEAPTP